MASQVGSRAFVDAAACGDLDEVKHLLTDAGLAASTINAIDKDGRSAFHYACLNDDAPLLRVLLADARVDVHLRSPRGDTGLHMAALYAAQEALKLLFADGRADVNAANGFRETPLHLCAGSGDKGAAAAAGLLLANGASMTLTDQWGRAPKTVSHDNAENPLVAVFDAHLADKPALVAELERLRLAYDAMNKKKEHNDEANRAAKKSIFGQLGAVKLKKATTVEKKMFRAGEGATTATAASRPTDGRTALSKLVDFPGDLAAIAAHLENPAKIDPAGADAYGLTALHKFASWNKSEYLQLLIPKLAKQDLDAPDPYGKTALHWAVEMASVAACVKSRKTRRARTMRRFDSGPGRGVSKKKSQDVVTVIKSKTFQFDRQKSRHQNATMLKTSSTVKSALNVFSSAVKRLR